MRHEYKTSLVSDSMGLNNHLWSIILAGGEGERMRPFIRRWLGHHKPKQYCTFVGSRSLFQHTVDRFSSDVLQRASERLAVMEMEGVHWSDWGRPDRIAGTLHRLGKRPAFSGEHIELARRMLPRPGKKAKAEFKRFATIRGSRPRTFQRTWRLQSSRRVKEAQVRNCQYFVTLTKCCRPPTDQTASFEPAQPVFLEA